MFIHLSHFGESISFYLDANFKSSFLHSDYILILPNLTVMSVSRSTKDGGWAWVILVAAFVNLTLSGIIYTNGIFNLVFLEEFGESRALTSWAGAAQVSVRNAGGELRNSVLLYTNTE